MASHMDHRDSLCELGVHCCTALTLRAEKSVCDALLSSRSYTTCLFVTRIMQRKSSGNTIPVH